jgi:hypothetical protein
MSSLTGPVPPNALASVLLLELGVPWQRCSLGCADKNGSTGVGGPERRGSDSGGDAAAAVFRWHKICLGLVLF